MSDLKVYIAILNALMKKPLLLFLLFLAIAGTGWLALFVLPLFGIANKEWGYLVWLLTIFFTILAVLHGIFINIYPLFKRVLLFSPIKGRSFWELAEQPDGWFSSAVKAFIQVSNTSPLDVQIINAPELLKPKNTNILLRDIAIVTDNGYGSDTITVAAYSSVTLDIYIAVKGKLEEQGNPLYIEIGITDQYGKKYKIKMNINSVYSDKTK